MMSPRERSDLRRSLIGETDAFVVGFLGRIKPYKNIDAIRQLPAALGDGRPVYIVVAGSVERGFENHVKTVSGSVSPERLRRIDTPLSDSQLDQLIQGVDVVFLPYTRGFNSGAALLVLSNRSRMLCSDLPIFRELESAVDHPWVYTFRTAPDCVQVSLADRLEEAALAGSGQEATRRLDDFLHKSSFSRGASLLADFYLRL
jgi:glycosyltransferase involved in cell wall biosynthesis